MFYDLYNNLGSTIEFPELTTLEDNAFEEGFPRTYISNIRFPKYANVTSNSLYNMMYSHSTSTVIHFPANMQSVISSLSQYPYFGGSSSYISCAFDL